MGLPLPLSVLCGQLLVGGFAGPTMPGTFRLALSRGERAGAVLFRRNVVEGLGAVAALTRAIVDTAPSHLPPLVAVDQEGGRVARLGPPVVRLPPMRAIGRTGDAHLAERVAKVLGGQLGALGVTMDFAPVLDVDTCASNPVIGDRSFGPDPSVVARLGRAFARGLQGSGVLACGKHFPGHGDTTVDSHLDLPRVRSTRDRLEAVELVPFRGLRAAGCAAVMTAHVVYDAFDPGLPATLCRPIVHDLLRGSLGFDGVVISDDLEMKAVADRYPIEQSSVMAVRAGCDLLLVCSDEGLQGRAHEALVHAAERDATLRHQIEASVARTLRLRGSAPVRPVEWSAAVEAELARQSEALERDLRELSPENLGQAVRH